MSPAEAMFIGQEGIWTLLKITLPILLIALIVGLVISFLQAITQIQEATISFVPKMVFVFMGVMLFLPIIGKILGGFFKNSLLYMLL